VFKYTNMKFEPAGITDDPELRIATSLVDYIFRRIALDYLSVEERADLGILSTSERMQPTLPGVEEMATPSVGLVDDGPAGIAGADAGAGVAPGPGNGIVTGTRSGTGPNASAGIAGYPLARAEQRDAPYCYSCGNAMQRAGSCYVCGSCGTTSGCS
jgi:ribonucleoside-diphosphate reductase alpha chain